MLRALYYAGLRALALPALARRFGTGGVILCYHNVQPVLADSAAGDPAIHLSPERFATQMEWLARHYDVVPLRDIVDRLSTGRSLRGLAAVAFDDAYAGVFDHAWPLLLELGLPAIVFVVADAPDRCDAFWWDHPVVARQATPERRERWLTELRGNGAAIRSAAVATAAPALRPSQRPAGWEVIARAAAAGLALGVHSATHRTLTALDAADLKREICDSWDTLCERTGARAEFFAYPYGRWDARVRDAVRAAGYRGAVTLDPRLVTATDDPWALPRINVPASISDGAFEAWLAGLSPRRGTAG